jgi:hypothetical protein
MTEKKGFFARMKRANERLHEEGLLMVLQLMLRQGLAWIRILFNPFYYLKEALPTNIPTSLTSIPTGFEFSLFGLEEMATICKHPERRSYVNEQYVFDNFQMGDICLGLKYYGEIAGFTWYSLKENRSWLYQSKMKENEAFLYDIFVFKAFRRRNLSLILRFKCYEILSGMGRDTFYSITDYSNTASYRFKQKLNAKAVFLGLQIEFFGKWRKTLVLKRYPS